MPKPEARGRAAGGRQPVARKRKASLSQADVPSLPVRDTLRVPRALAELGRVPSTPVQVAAAMNVQPTTGNFRMLTAASAAYGLTEGGAWAERIALTPLGRAVVAPVEEGQEDSALAMAVMRPRVVRMFLERYNGSKWPRKDIACNVLVDMGVPAEQAERAHDTIHANAAQTGLLTTISGNEYVSLDKPHALTSKGRGDAQEAANDGTHVGVEAPSVGPTIDLSDRGASEVDTAGPGSSTLTTPQHAAFPGRPASPALAANLDAANPAPGRIAGTSLGATYSLVPGAGHPQSRTTQPRNVFISSKAGDPVAGEIATLLQFGDFDPLVRNPDQDVLDNSTLGLMRSCGAGIILLRADPDGNVSTASLLEVGAAIALFGSRLVLLVHDHLQLPDLLSKQRVVSFSGNSLEHAATLRLMGILVEFKVNLT